MHQAIACTLVATPALAYITTVKSDLANDALSSTSIENL